MELKDTFLMRLRLMFMIAFSAFTLFEVKQVNYLKTQCNAYANRMWQLGFNAFWDIKNESICHHPLYLLLCLVDAMLSCIALFVGNNKLNLSQLRTKGKWATKTNSDTFTSVCYSKKRVELLCDLGFLLRASCLLQLGVFSN